MLSKFQVRIYRPLPLTFDIRTITQRGIHCQPQIEVDDIQIYSHLFLKNINYYIYFEIFNSVNLAMYKNLNLYIYFEVFYSINSINVQRLILLKKYFDFLKKKFDNGINQFGIDSVLMVKLNSVSLVGVNKIQFQHYKIIVN